MEGAEGGPPFADGAPAVWEPSGWTQARTPAGGKGPEPGQPPTAGVGQQGEPLPKQQGVSRVPPNCSHMDLASSSLSPVLKGKWGVGVQENLRRSFLWVKRTRFPSLLSLCPLGGGGRGKHPRPLPPAAVTPTATRSLPSAPADGPRCARRQRALSGFVLFFCNANLLVSPGGTATSRPR